jgi:hypothetical protein
MIIDEYGVEAWECHADLKNKEWKDSVFYPDEEFFKMIDILESQLEINSKKVGKVLCLFRDICLNLITSNILINVNM